MTLSEAAELRRLWIAKGNPKCDHPKLDDELFDPIKGVESDLRTGDFVCTTCGKAFQEKCD